MYHVRGLSNAAYRKPPAMRTPNFMYDSGLPLSFAAMTDSKHAYVTESWRVGYGIHTVAIISDNVNDRSGLETKRMLTPIESARGITFRATT